MFKNRFRVSIVLSIIIIVLAIIASIGGLIIKDLYNDNENIKAVWFANDIITLFIAVPILIGALILSVKGSLRAQLIWIGTLWYMVYNYVFYVYGAVFNMFFLLYVALFTLSAYALIFALIKVNATEISKRFNERTPIKWVSGYLLFFATSLGIPWIAMPISFIFTGQVANSTNNVVFATDLSLIISVLIVSGILLWKKRPWGYVLSIMILIKGLLYPMVLLIGGALSYSKTGNWDPFIPMYILLWIGCIISFLTLITNMKPLKMPIEVKHSISQLNKGEKDS